MIILLCVLLPAAAGKAAGKQKEKGSGQNMNRPDIVLLAETGSLHRHEHAQIILPLATPLQLRIGSEVFTIGRTEIGFIPPDTPHQCVCDQQLLTVNIPRAMLSRRDAPLLSKARIFAGDEQTTAVASLIRSEVSANPNSSAVRYLYFYLYEKMVEQVSHSSVRYMHEHYDEPLRVTQLAALENYNVTYFNDWFRRQTGTTPLQYLRQLRIDRARELLESTDYSVIDIAAQVGYTSHSAFTRAFREVVGMAPLAYRSISRRGGRDGGRDGGRESSGVETMAAR